MTCHCFGNGCVCIGADATRIIEAGGKRRRFEMHRYLGPVVLGQRDQEVKQPGARDHFWRAVMLWDLQGRRISEDGLCQWDELPLQRWKQIGRRAFRHCQPGEKADLLRPVSDDEILSMLRDVREDRKLGLRAEVKTS